MTRNDAVTMVQNRLRGDVDRLREYGRSCPGEWGGLWFEETVLVVGLTPRALPWVQKMHSLQTPPSRCYPTCRLH